MNTVHNDGEIKVYLFLPKYSLENLIAILKGVTYSYYEKYLN